MSKTMKTEHIQTSGELERCPFPIPFGWYVIDYSESLEVGEIRNIQAFDQEWVIFRGGDGSVGVTDPFCPHLGAHLGLGGEVVGNNIRCPFHHWEYDSEGWCKNIPYAKRMPKVCQDQAVLRVLPTSERYGLIWAWYHPEREAPSFDLPEVPELEAEVYIPVRHGEWQIGTCLQEIGENSVDFPHLKFLHGAPEMPLGSAVADGHVFKFDIDAGSTTIVGECHGPGAQVVRHTAGDTTVLMFSTPLPQSTDMTLSRMHFTFRDAAEGTAGRTTAEHVYQHSIGAADGEESAGFEAVDMVIWNNKKYRPKPILCDGDGPIAKWRKYYRQFYSQDDA
ncbi:FeS-binding protein [Seongchinamella unica]|uniref:cholesterol 7-desaturase n=1 Tax=Seongchinamella unica TaxID=2547392 RepID=A0A4R5LMQ7_9GAMM|nr:Rieske 2Fe-2S domain-containing protein [Seongchinamella unica]TDG11311.1 FeS-binding protein [Seongchinamella unica]